MMVLPPGNDISGTATAHLDRRPGAHRHTGRGHCHGEARTRLPGRRRHSERGDGSEDPPPRSSPRFGTARVRGTPRSPMTLRGYRFTLRTRHVKEIRKFHDSAAEIDRLIGGMTDHRSVRRAHRGRVAGGSAAGGRRFSRSWPGQERLSVSSTPKALTRRKPWRS